MSHNIVHVDLATSVRTIGAVQRRGPTRLLSIRLPTALASPNARPVRRVAGYSCCRRERDTMCSDHDHGDVRRLEPEIPAEMWRGEMLELEPVDEVVIVSLCDNTIDLLLADEGPARRLPLGGEPIRVAR